MDVLQIARRYEDYVIRIRREFHRIPEPSLMENETCGKIKKELEQMGFHPQVIADTGLIVDIEGGYPGKTVGLRADIDALPVTEETGAPYASLHDGYMHACGHDAHIAMALGAAQILKEIRQELHGRVRILFEPGEEVAKGALKMIAAGALEGVDTIFGMHVWSDIPAGKISVEAGPRMASADFFTLDVQGQSCHGSLPQQGVDAVVVGAAIVNSLQTVVSRSVNPLDPAVVSVCEFHAGSCHNAIAGSAFMSGTTRAFSVENRLRFPTLMERVIQNTAQAYGAKATLSYEMGSSPVINDETCSELAKAAVIKILGEDGVTRFEKTPGGENFSEYQRLVPGVFAFVGVRNPNLDAVHSQHSCYYKMDESALANGSAVAVEYALQFLSQTNHL